MKPATVKTLIQPRSTLRAFVREAAASHELLTFLVLREFLVKYKQTKLGFAWAVVKPVVLTAVMVLSFGELLRGDMSRAAYASQVVVSVVPFLVFSQTLSSGVASLAGNAGLISKVYFPRVLLPLTAACVALVDSLIAALLALFVALAVGATLGPNVLFLVLSALLASACAVGLALLLGGLAVRYRDVNFALPFFVQALYFGSPVGFPIERLSVGAQQLMALNPLTGAVDLARHAVGTGTPDAGRVLYAVAFGVVALACGVVHFAKVEARIVDHL